VANPSAKLCVAILYGGRSAEHDVSVMSAKNVILSLSPEKYAPMPIYVTRAGRWVLGRLEDGNLATPEQGTEICLVPGGGGRLLAIPESGRLAEEGRIDALFPVLHGLHGEDGSVQGLAEVARVPLVGCGILGSAVALDKVVTKRLLQSAGLPVTRSVTIQQGSAPLFAALETELGLPMFIKPARQGSSVGVRKVHASQEFASALAEGFKHDRKLLAEEFADGREIEFAVLEDSAGNLLVSRPGEIIPAENHGFYSYEAKYIDENGAALKVPAELPEALEGAMRDMAAKAFRAVGCDGMARIDFFLMPSGCFQINELNTIPGFTDVSMYPRLMEFSGVPYADLLNILILQGISRNII